MKKFLKTFNESNYNIVRIFDYKKSEADYNANQKDMIASDLYFNQDDLYDYEYSDDYNDACSYLMNYFKKNGFIDHNKLNYDDWNKYNDGFVVIYRNGKMISKHYNLAKEGVDDLSDVFLESFDDSIIDSVDVDYDKRCIIIDDGYIVAYKYKTNFIDVANYIISTYNMSNNSDDYNELIDEMMDYLNDLDDTEIKKMPREVMEYMFDKQIEWGGGDFPYEDLTHSFFVHAFNDLIFKKLYKK